MTLALFLLDALPDSDTFSLTGDEGRHAARVRRIGVGEHLTVSDGRGAVAECEVTAVLSDGLALSVLSRSSLELPSPRLVVVQALPKGERADLAVETMTELGVDEIVPWAASRSVVQWQGERGAKALVKWQRTAREAAKQSRRAWVPVISELVSTAAVARRIAASAGLVLHEGATVSIGALALPAVRELVVVVGPEGGISSDELAVFDSAGALAVRLGEPVLRTSTAGAAALAALSLRLGRWG
jgi:16S rRNA (uracil1498-N3)-methyltransferase